MLPKAACWWLATLPPWQASWGCPRSHLSAPCTSHTCQLLVSAAAADVTSSRIVTYQLTGDTTLDEGEDCQFIQKMVLSLIEGTTLDEREDCQQTGTLMLLLL